MSLTPQDQPTTKILNHLKSKSKAKIGFEVEDKNEIKKQKLVVLKDLLNECKDNNIKIWLRDKINELLIELLI